MKKKIITISIIIVAILILMIILTLPLIISLPSSDCDDLKTIGTIDERKVYSYCTDVISIPSLNKNMTTEKLEKGTLKIETIWDGGTTINKGIGYIIVDCSDNLKTPRKSPLIITKGKYKDNAIKYCSKYISDKYKENE